MLPNNATTRTINGITFTVNNDGSIGTSGTSTDGVGNFIIGQITPQQSGEYILSGCNGGTDNTYFFNFDDGITTYKQYNDEIRLNLVGGTTYTLKLWIATSGVDMSNKTFYPMVRPASIADDTYAPYAQTNKELTANLNGFKFYPTGTGIVGLISDDSAYTDEDGNYVVWGTATADALVEASPNTYKSVPSAEDTRGKVGADTAIPFRKQVLQS